MDPNGIAAIADEARGREDQVRLAFTRRQVGDRASSYGVPQRSRAPSPR